MRPLGLGLCEPGDDGRTAGWPLASTNTDLSTIHSPYCYYKRYLS
jgi:hypothetical protein